MRRETKTAVVVVSLLFVFVIKAQEPVFRQFSLKNGAPSDEIHYVYEDSKGYVWFCSEVGVAKYNGNYFKLYDTYKGLPDNLIFEVKEDLIGRIWFRSFSGKIGYIKNDSVFNIEANAVISDFVKEGLITSLCIDANMNVWLGKQNSNKSSFIKIGPPYHSDNVTYVGERATKKFGLEIMMIDKSNLTFSDTRGISYKGEYYKISLYDKDRRLLLTDSLPGTEASPRIYRWLKDNILYLSMGRNFRRYDLNSGTVYTQHLDYEGMPVFTTDKYLIIGSMSTGAYLYNGSKPDSLSEHILEGKTITSIMKDYQGGLWFSTLEAGVFYLSANSVKKYTFDNDAVISSMVNISDNELLVGFSNGSISKLSIIGDMKIRVEKLYQDETNTANYINTAIRIGERVFVVGTGGSFVYDLKKGKVVTEKVYSDKLNNSYKEVARYGSKVYLCNIKDIYVTDTSFKEMKYLCVLEDRMTALACDDLSGTLYVGGIKGLYAYEGRNKINENEKISSGRIRDLHINNGHMFITTRLPGLIVRSKDGIDTLDESTGLVGNFCKSISIADNALWVGTTKGLSKVIYKKKGEYRITNYPMDHFVDPVVAFSVCKLNSAMVFYSGKEIYLFKEGKTKQKDRFYVSSFTINGISYLNESLPKLKYNAGEFRAEFEALFYKSSRKIQYRYKIGKDFAGDWTYTHETNINFPSLSPGSYTLSFEAMNTNGEWVRANRDLRFIIAKPFWADLWFIIIGIIAVSGGLGFGIYLWYSKRLKKENERVKEQIHLHELEMKAIRSQMNPHFIFNSLNTLQRFILEEDTVNGHSYLTKFSKLLRKMLESGTADSITLSEEVSILRNYIDVEKLRFTNTFEYEIRIHVPNPDSIKIPFMMIQPFIENAIWHGLMPKQNNRSLKVDFYETDADSIRCVIDDNGVGRDYTKKEKNPLKKKSLAFDFIAQRLELFQKFTGIKCYFTITDKKTNGRSDGTTIDIIIPKLK